MNIYVHYTRQKGFNILEMMVVLVVLIVLASIAAPNYQRFTSNSKVKSGAQTLFSAMLYARSEAIKRNADVTITPSDSADWASGWQITAAGVATPLRQQDALNGVLEVPASNIAGIVYNGSGRIEAAAVDIRFCDNKPVPADRKATRRKITVSLTGRPKIESDGACSS